MGLDEHVRLVGPGFYGVGEPCTCRLVGAAVFDPSGDMSFSISLATLEGVDSLFVGLV